MGADMPATCDESEDRSPSVFADWAERHQRVANTMAAVLMAVPLTGAVALTDEPTGTVVWTFLGTGITVLAFFEIASRIAGRPVLPGLLGGGGDAHYDDGRAGRGDGWFGDSGGGGGGGGDGGGGGGG